MGNLLRREKIGKMCDKHVEKKNNVELYNICTH